MKIRRARRKDQRVPSPVSAPSQKKGQERKMAQKKGVIIMTRFVHIRIFLAVSLFI